MRSLLTTTALLAFPATAVAVPDAYLLDPVHTYTYFSVEHFGISNQFGRFNRNAGKITIDRVTRTASVDVTVDTTSVDTADAERGSRSRSRDDVLPRPISQRR